MFLAQSGTVSRHYAVAYRGHWMTCRRPMPGVQALALAVSVDEA